jgi:hypothetical protein
MTKPISDETTARLKEDLQRASDDLKKAAEDIRVQIHLAGKDAKDAWNKLEPSLDDFQHRVERAVDITGDELKKLGRDLKSRLHDLKARLGKV